MISKILSRIVVFVFVPVILCTQVGVFAAQAENQFLYKPDKWSENIDPDTLEIFLDEYIPENMERSHVPGLVITVVQGDQVLVSKGYGYADLADQIPMTPQTNIRAGSVSKSVTATAVIKLVEQGILDLDAPVSEYITAHDLEDQFGQVRLDAR